MALHTSAVLSGKPEMVGRDEHQGLLHTAFEALLTSTQYCIGLGRIGFFSDVGVRGLSWQCHGSR